MDKGRERKKFTFYSLRMGVVFFLLEWFFLDIKINTHTQTHTHTTKNPKISLDIEWYRWIEIFFIVFFYPFSRFWFCMVYFLFCIYVFFFGSNKHTHAFPFSISWFFFVCFSIPFLSNKKKRKLYLWTLVRCARLSSSSLMMWIQW